jgi:uncharacterized protein YnzC (UPF0291/DUF896 family)
VDAEKSELAEMRKKFLEEVDKRVQKKLEDWENVSVTTL